MIIDRVTGVVLITHLVISGGQVLLPIIILACQGITNRAQGALPSCYIGKGMASALWYVRQSSKTERALPICLLDIFKLAVFKGSIWGESRSLGSSIFTKSPSQRAVMCNVLKFVNLIEFVNCIIRVLPERILEAVTIA